MSEQTIDMRKIRVEDLDQVQHAEYAMKSLKKAARYLKFFNELDTGMEVSSKMIRDIERMQRALSHRLHVLKKVA
ncbi:hypothetical protein LCGC14_0471960 [marine sediment metagenome]|uniref:Uncharacterized protein n=1 Tax=marine sediment metagenome TaxID=412755 RepID=A0A0F9SBY4_9ZZZZ